MPPQTPKELFARLFGAAPRGRKSNQPPAEDTSPAAIKARMRHSVLDAVLDQYKHFTGDAGNLGKASRTTLKAHLDHIRDLERRAAMLRPMKDSDATNDATDNPEQCARPSEPGDARLSYRNNGDGDGIDVTVTDLVAEVRLMADLFAAGVACDRVRFGTFVFTSAGERYRLKGTYKYKGKTIAEFDDPKALNGNSNGKGAQNCAHEFWHRNDFTWCRRHLHLVFDQLAYLLDKLDAIKDPNGQSVFDNAMLTITTESGSGQHKSAAHELGDVFHIIGSAGGRFKVGADRFTPIEAHGIELYNAMLAAHGVPKAGRLWDGRGNASRRKSGVSPAPHDDLLSSKRIGNTDHQGAGVQYPHPACQDMKEQGDVPPSKEIAKNHLLPHNRQQGHPPRGAFDPHPREDHRKHGQQHEGPDIALGLSKAPRETRNQQLHARGNGRQKQATQQHPHQTTFIKGHGHPDALNRNALKDKKHRQHGQNSAKGGHQKGGHPFSRRQGQTGGLRYQQGFQRAPLPLTGGTIRRHVHAAQENGNHDKNRHGPENLSCAAAGLVQAHHLNANRVCNRGTDPRDIRRRAASF